mgnify:CR=1 FL=1|jgi:hypothetical protein
MIEYNLRLTEEARQLIGQASRLTEQIAVKLQQNRMQNVPLLSEQCERALNEAQVMFLIRESLYGY